MHLYCDGGCDNKHLLYMIMKYEKDGDGHIVQTIAEQQSVQLPGCFGARLGLPLVGSLAL